MPDTQPDLNQRSLDLAHDSLDDLDALMSDPHTSVKRLTDLVQKLTDGVQQAGDDASVAVEITVSCEDAMLMCSALAIAAGLLGAHRHAAGRAM